jgi:ribosomal 50S subunit-associated protein YjgA (DUF615 family)
VGHIDSYDTWPPITSHHVPQTHQRLLRQRSFVAEGSDLDLELKREQKGHDLSSKTDMKRESTELQKLGEDLLELRQDAMLQFGGARTRARGFA